MCWMRHLGVILGRAPCGDPAQVPRRSRPHLGAYTGRQDIIGRRHLPPFTTATSYRDPFIKIRQLRRYSILLLKYMRRACSFRQLDDSPSQSPLKHGNDRLITGSLRPPPLRVLQEGAECDIGDRFEVGLEGA